MFKGVNFLLKYCWTNSKRYIVFLSIHQLINAILPLLIIIMPKYILDELVNQQRIELLATYIVILVLGNYMCTMISNYFNIKAFTYKMSIFNNFQVFLSEKLTKIDYKYLEDPEFLDLKEKAYKFLYADGMGFAYILDRAFYILGKIIVFIGIISVLATLNIFIVIIFILLVLMSSFVESRYKKENVKINMEQSKYERYNYYYADILNNFNYGKEMRLCNMGTYVIDKYKSKLKLIWNYYNRTFNNNLKSMQINATATFLQQAISYGYITSQIILKKLSIGDFMMYITAVNSFASSMREVMSSIIDIRRFEDYYIAVEEYLAIPEISKGGIKIDDNDFMVIEFKNVSFKYPKQENYILKNINLKISQGEKISIVGENGAGKTTFLKLLTRLYNPTEGQILINNIDIRDIDYDTYMLMFSVVFQDYKLFSMSLKENISLNSQTDDSLIKGLLEKCGLEKKLNNLKEGIDTSVYKNFDANGFEPSGGEGQKIALARALYKNGPIMILDEPTAALDPKSEYEIFKSFNDLTQGKTVLYISHRLSSAKLSDRILVFEQGRIIEEGNHDILMGNDCKYAELFNLQAQYYV